MLELKREPELTLSTGEVNEYLNRIRRRTCIDRDA
jgi:hypothetical protein